MNYSATNSISFNQNSYLKDYFLVSDHGQRQIYRFPKRSIKNVNRFYRINSESKKVKSRIFYWNWTKVEDKVINVCIFWFYNIILEQDIVTFMK
jgi:hypothetical protein